VRIFCADSVGEEIEREEVEFIEEVKEEDVEEVGGVEEDEEGEGEGRREGLMSTAALLTRTSIPPYWSEMSFAKDSTDFSSQTSN
jgi:hypothetical protein